MTAASNSVTKCCCGVCAEGIAVFFNKFIFVCFLTVKIPPAITTQPESVTVFSVEDLVMRCEASGNPSPTFHWTKDGEEFDPSSDPEMKVTEEAGSSVFYTLSNTMDTLKQYQGKYICYASNELGTAVSNAAVLMIDGKLKKVTEKAEAGHSIALSCNPPQSSMQPIIHWMDNSECRLRHIRLSDRVMVGKDGNLYFANLLTEDSRNDYTCNIQYLATRTILAKEPITLTVNPSNLVPRNRRPQMMRPTGSHSTYHALRGQTLELECIVQGLPTPKVSWLRKDGEMSESRISKDMFDRRLQFTNISESDGGEYQCTAENDQGRTFHTYTVTVEASPYWTNAPVSQLYAPGETVKLDCQADGIPSPTITWTVNGVPLSGQRSLTESGSLILKDVIFGDTAIYQCQASNKHGTILANTNVYVIELPPQILTENGNTYTFVEGQKALLECETFGSPKPKPVWLNSNRALISLLLADPRVNLLTNGGLEIRLMSTAPRVVCLISECLLLPDRTVILSPPQALRLQPGKTAIFTCLYVTDPKLSSPLLQWRKNDQKIFESHSDKKYTFDGPGLIISNVEPGDEGVYTCQIITKLDMVEASSTLTLCDRPDPPVHLQVTNAKHRVVTLNWTPGDDNNSPILEYVVEFEDQDMKENGWEELKRVAADKKHVNLPLWPYMSYRFRVIAINDQGKSDPSKLSDLYKTPADAPDSNPEDVRSESTDPDTLVITWEEMDKRNFNGPDFKYLVMWRRVVGSGPDWHEEYTIAPPFIVTDVQNFSAFEIKVQAVNKKGLGPEPDPVIGYSGEDVPLEAPLNLGVLLENSTTIRVTWAAVDKETVRGHLLGYKIYLTWGHHRNSRAQEPENIVMVQTGANEEKKSITNLRPYCHYDLAISAFNSKGEGPLSEKTSFMTPEGVPGPPMSMQMTSPSESEITLHWTPPSKPNGILLGYSLQYRKSDDDNPLQVVDIASPEITHLTLKGLDRHSHYQFLLMARTAAGKGLSIEILGATTLEGCNLFFAPSEGVTEVQPSFATQGWFIGVVSAVVLLLLVLLILCFIKRSKGGKYSVKDKEDGPMDSEARPMKDETFGEYSDLEEKRTASQPSLGEDSKLCSEDNLDFNGSSAVTTELNMDESLASQFSRHSEGPEPFHGVPDNSPLNPAANPPATNGAPSFLN
uniref:Neural cell adhesion molecule L1 n=1 Tax=Takifugu rubripes TaxID=31033 RepID=A0A674P783_TAKRU